MLTSRQEFYMAGLVAVVVLCVIIVGVQAFRSRACTIEPVRAKSSTRAPPDIQPNGLTATHSAGPGSTIGVGGGGSGTTYSTHQPCLRTGSCGGGNGGPGASGFSPRGGDGGPAAPNQIIEYDNDGKRVR